MDKSDPLFGQFATKIKRQCLSQLKEYQRHRIRYAFHLDKFKDNQQPPFLFPQMDSYGSINNGKRVTRNRRQSEGKPSYNRHAFETEDFWPCGQIPRNELSERHKMPGRSMDGRDEYYEFPMFLKNATGRPWRKNQSKDRGDNFGRYSETSDNENRAYRAPYINVYSRPCVKSHEYPVLPTKQDQISALLYHTSHNRTGRLSKISPIQISLDQPRDSVSKSSSEPNSGMSPYSGEEYRSPSTTYDYPQYDLEEQKQIVEILRARDKRHELRLSNTLDCQNNRRDIVNLSNNSDSFKNNGASFLSSSASDESRIAIHLFSKSKIPLAFSENEDSGLATKSSDLKELSSFSLMSAVSPVAKSSNLKELFTRNMSAVSPVAKSSDLKEPCTSSLRNAVSQVAKSSNLKELFSNKISAVSPVAKNSDLKELSTSNKIYAVDPVAKISDLKEPSSSNLMPTVSLVAKSSDLEEPCMSSLRNAVSQVAKSSDFKETSSSNLMSAVSPVAESSDLKEPSAMDARPYENEPDDKVLENINQTLKEMALRNEEFVDCVRVPFYDKSNDKDRETGQFDYRIKKDDKNENDPVTVTNNGDYPRDKNNESVKIVISSNLKTADKREASAVFQDVIPSTNIRVQNFQDSRIEVLYSSENCQGRVSDKVFAITAKNVTVTIRGTDDYAGKNIELTVCNSKAN